MATAAPLISGAAISLVHAANVPWHRDTPMPHSTRPPSSIPSLRAPATKEAPVISVNAPVTMGCESSLHGRAELELIEEGLICNDGCSTRSVVAREYVGQRETSADGQRSCVSAQLCLNQHDRKGCSKVGERVRSECAEFQVSSCFMGGDICAQSFGSLPTTRRATGGSTIHGRANGACPAILAGPELPDGLPACRLGGRVDGVHAGRAGLFSSLLPSCIFTGLLGATMFRQRFPDPRLCRRAGLQVRRRGHRESCNCLTRLNSTDVLHMIVSAVSIDAQPGTSTVRRTSFKVTGIRGRAGKHLVCPHLLLKSNHGGRLSAGKIRTCGARSRLLLGAVADGSPHGDLACPAGAAPQDGQSDVAKWIEGACYHLQSHPDPEIQSHVDHLANLIEKAQQPDGYLNIHFVVNKPDERWTNLRDLHELYNFGHLIEGALAHQAQCGSDQLIKVMLRFVDYCCTVFGNDPDKLAGYPGHPEVELALLRLYHRTRYAKCLELAAYFLTERGKDGGQFYKDEQAKRGEHKHTIPGMMPKPYSFWYMQAHKPIVEQDTIEGHSVRAMYLLTAVQDLVVTPDSTRFVSEQQIEQLSAAAMRLWKSMVLTKMYVTGGIGSIKQWEGFSIPYSLPLSTDEGGCYTETCAGIGALMLADRLLHEKLDGDVGDVAERVLYNSSITTGMSVDGRAFTYVNQLASSAEEPCERFDWFESTYDFPGDAQLVDGYIAIQRPGEYELTLQLKPRLLFSHPDSGPSRVSLAYGPLIYCIEDIDNPWIDDLPEREQHFKHLCLDLPAEPSQISVLEQDSDGIIKLRVAAAGYTLRVDDAQGFASAFEQDKQPGFYEEAGKGRDLVFIPYFYRCNRKGTKGRMRTSLRVKP
ncbi:hypothetical protein L1887_59890 [Cichorium endivia]|nr:hypothetical protein L1887_59890 [Cichorium endivia]